MSSRETDTIDRVGSYINQKRHTYKVSFNNKVGRLRDDQNMIGGMCVGLFSSFLLFTSFLQVSQNPTEIIWFVLIIASFGGLKLMRDSLQTLFDKSQ